VLSPQLRSQTNRLDVHYHLNTPARVSSQIVSNAGQQWSITTDALRPTAGEYVLQFDGTVAGPGPNERRVLPDGDYQVLLDVQSEGQHQQERVPLVVRGADIAIPDVTDLALLPDRISPNFDALDDVTHVTYRLTKNALVSPFLDTNPAGFEWIDCNDNLTSTISLLRKSEIPKDTVLIVCNFTPVPRLGYRIGVPAGGYWRELLNSDALE